MQMSDERFRLALAIAAIEAPVKAAGLVSQWLTLNRAQEALAQPVETEARLRNAEFLLRTALTHAQRANNAELAGLIANYLTVYSYGV